MDEYRNYLTQCPMCGADLNENSKVCPACETNLIGYNGQQVSADVMKSRQAQVEQLKREISQQQREFNREYHAPKGYTVKVDTQSSKSNTTTYTPTGNSANKKAIKFIKWFLIFIFIIEPLMTVLFAILSGFPFEEMFDAINDEPPAITQAPSEYENIDGMIEIEVEDSVIKFNPKFFYQVSEHYNRDTRHYYPIMMSYEYDSHNGKMFIGSKVLDIDACTSYAVYRTFDHQLITPNVPSGTTNGIFYEASGGISSESRSFTERFVYSEGNIDDVYQEVVNYKYDNINELALLHINGMDVYVYYDEDYGDYFVGLTHLDDNWYYLMELYAPPELVPTIKDNPEEWFYIEFIMDGLTEEQKESLGVGD